MKKKTQTSKNAAKLEYYSSAFTLCEWALISCSVVTGAFLVRARDSVWNEPHDNPDRILIKGSVCGVKIDAIEDPLMKEIRYLDKLVDELARGKAMEKIKRTKKKEANHG